MIGKSILILFIWLSSIFGVSFAIIPNVGNKDKSNSNDQHDEPGHLSLPNLLQANNINDLDLTWDVLSNIKLDTGRLVIDKSNGAVWSKAHLANTGDEWTIEMVFRSSGTAKNDLAFGDTNGLALWLIDSSNSLPINDRNVDNFGGPSQFDGFQFLINTNEKRGLKIFNNDGTKTLKNSIEQSIGDCTFNYLDSLVPFTVRVSYSKLRKWFKVQIDNNLCFKTDKIILPDDLNDFMFGITGNISPSSQEVYEILKLNVWTHLTNDAIDDHALMSDGHLKIEYKTVTADDSKDTYIPPSRIRESLMERNRKHKEEILRQQREAYQQGKEDNKIDLLLNDIVFKLENIELRLSSMDSSVDSGDTSYDTKVLGAQLKDITTIQTQQQEALSNLQQSYDKFKTTLGHQYTELLQSVSKLNEKVIGEVREHQYSTEEIGKKVDLLMSNHKEVAYQYQNGNNESKNNEADLLPSIIRWVLIPVVVGIILLTIVVYRLRHDIKHSKLL